jgi:hypothetical protein
MTSTVRTQALRPPFRDLLRTAIFFVIGSWFGPYLVRLIYSASEVQWSPVARAHVWLHSTLGNRPAIALQFGVVEVVFGLLIGIALGLSCYRCCYNAVGWFGVGYLVLPQLPHIGFVGPRPLDQPTIQLLARVVLFAATAFPAAWLAAHARRQRDFRRRAGLCVYCAYNLTGNVSGICPECGQPAKKAQQAWQA